MPLVGSINFYKKSIKKIALSSDSPYAIFATCSCTVMLLHRLSFFQSMGNWHFNEFQIGRYMPPTMLLVYHKAAEIATSVYTDPGVFHETLKRLLWAKILLPVRPAPVLNAFLLFHMLLWCICSLKKPHRTGRLTKLPQGKQGIPDHIRPGLFIDPDTDALRFQPDSWRGYRTITRSLQVCLPKGDLDNFLFWGGRTPCLRNLTGFSAQSTDVIVKCANRDSVI